MKWALEVHLLLQVIVNVVIVDGVIAVLSLDNR